MKSVVIYALAFGGFVSGCATNLQQNPYETLRLASVNLVDTYTQEIRIFLKDGNEQQALIKAKTVIENQLKDPLSAQFRNVMFKPYGSGTVVCGEVNGKNSYGAYNGFQRFVAGVYSASLYQSSQNSELDRYVNAGLQAACG